MSKCDKNTQMKKPTIRKFAVDDWIVYEDSIPPPLKHPKTCTDTINSACGSGKSVEKCIQECDASELCSFGYHLKYGDNTTKCLPIYTSDYYPSANPTYSLKNKDCYDIPADVTSHSFISKKRWGKHGILPNEANAVFFDDTVLLGHLLKSDNSFLKNGSDGKVSFQKFGGGTKLKLLSEYGGGLTTRVEYGDHISFNIVNDDGGFTSNVMITEPNIISDTTENIIFKPYKNTFLSEKQKFTVIPVPGNKDFQFNYNSNFLLRTYDGFLQIQNKENISTLVINTTVDPTHNFMSLYDGNKKVDNINSMIFNFRPTKYIYTCEGGKCSAHKLIDAKRHRRSATVNGNKAYTRSDCFGSCNWKSGRHPKQNPKHPKVDTVKGNNDEKGTSTVDEKECTNNWCVALTIILIVLIMMSILVLW